MPFATQEDAFKGAYHSVVNKGAGWIMQPPGVVRQLDLNVDQINANERTRHCKIGAKGVQADGREPSANELHRTRHSSPYRQGRHS